MKLLSLSSELNEGLKRSIIAHFLILVTMVLYVFLKGTLFESKPLRYVPTLRVDLVALPDVLKQNAKLPHSDPFPLEKTKEKVQKMSPQKPKEREEPLASRVKLAPPLEEFAQKKSTGLVKNIEKRNKQALDRLKSLSKIQNSLSHSFQEGASATAERKVKGNKISPGSSLSGEAKEASEANYLGILQERLKEHFSLPIWVKRQNYDAQVKMYINAKGNLMGLQFIKPSGNPQFDSAVNRAVNESQPFPLPPENIAPLLATDGIRVGFPL